MSMWGFTKSEDGDNTLVTTKVLIAKADALFDQGNYKEVYDLLSNYNVNILFY